MAKVYVKFPKTGLGNLLLIWARAKVFAHNNNLALSTSEWSAIHWGAWVRGERKKRLYWGYFKSDSITQKITSNIYRQLASQIVEPENTAVGEGDKLVYVFNKVSSNERMFCEIGNHRDYLQAEIYKLLRPEMVMRLKQYDCPEISVHVRRGDFKLGSPITQISFFRDCILLLRSAIGRELPVTIFTDAGKEEIEDLLSMPSVNLAENKPDILDILLMSKSKAMILSRSSTFGYWAGFLSNAIIVKHPMDWQETIRPHAINEQIFEGKVDFSNPVELVEAKARIRNSFFNLNETDK